jgi:hypothetical protein
MAEKRAPTNRSWEDLSSDGFFCCLLLLLLVLVACSATYCFFCCLLLLHLSALASYGVALSRSSACEQGLILNACIHTYACMHACICSHGRTMLYMYTWGLGISWAGRNLTSISMQLCASPVASCRSNPCITQGTHLCEIDRSGGMPNVVLFLIPGVEKSAALSTTILLLRQTERERERDRETERQRDRDTMLGYEDKCCRGLGTTCQTVPPRRSQREEKHR